MKRLSRFLLGSLLLMALICAALLAALWFMTWMPGSSGEAIVRELTPEEARTAEDLRTHVEFLAQKPRNRDHPEHERAVLDYLERELREAGWAPKRLEVPAERGTYQSIAARRTGTQRPDELIVIGAHWDTHGHTPGADDNASGCAALIELARWLGERETERSVELIFWANEEPPFFQTEQMGSLQHADALREAGTDVVVAISLEMLGYYDPTEGAQKYPNILSLFYPEHGAFIAFVGSMWHREVVTESAGAFRENSDFPAYGFAGPEEMPGIGFSDQWSFWQNDYPALMVTDTSFFRTPHYHQLSDVSDTLDYPRFARVVLGLRSVIDRWAFLER